MSQNMIWPIDKFLKSHQEKETRQKSGLIFHGQNFRYLQVGMFLVPIFTVGSKHSRGKVLSCCVVKPSEVVEVGFLVFETDQTSGEPHATQWKICPEKIKK